MNFVTAIPWSAHAFGFGADLAAKVTVLLGVGLLVQQLVARWRASLGSAVANACLLGLLLVPCSALLLPAIELKWLPATSSNMRSPVRALAAADRGAVDGDGDASFEAPGVDRSPITSMTELRNSPASTASVSASSHAIIPPPSSVVVSPPTRRIDWLLLGITGYAVVAGVLLARLVASLVAVARLRDSSPHVAGGPWWLALERCRRRLGIDRPVGLACSPRVGVLVVLGWIRPTIVLPATLPGLSPDGHADAVLLHELSHVRRSDYPWHVLSRFVQAVYWPHPLVWLLGRTMAEMRERACDELCVHELGGPSRYREALLAVAQGVSRRASPALGLAMARSSRLRQRLARIEQSQGQALCIPTLRARLAIAVTAVMASMALGTIQLAQAHGRPLAAVVPVPRAEIDEAIQPQAGAGRVFHLRVVAADTGKPVPNAEVRLWIAFRDEWRKTDAEGRLDIVYATGPGDGDFAIDVWGEGCAMQRHDWGIDPSKPIPEGETIRLAVRRIAGRNRPGRPRPADRRCHGPSLEPQLPTPRHGRPRTAFRPAGRHRPRRQVAHVGCAADDRRTAGISHRSSRLSQRTRLRRQGDHPQDRRPPRRQGRDGDEEGRADRGPGGRCRRQAGRRSPGSLHESRTGNVCRAQAIRRFHRCQRPFSDRPGQIR